MQSVDETLDGPLGPIEGGMLASELHMDGSTEDKFFAPGYGEFSTSGGGDVEALALAVPTDAASGSMPPELTHDVGRRSRRSSMRPDRATGGPRRPRSSDVVCRVEDRPVRRTCPG